MWKIGNVEISNKVVLAPMAGVCNSAFRRIIKEMGCGLIYAEMINNKALVFNNKKTNDMLFMTDFERPIVQQIFGSDKESFAEAAKIVYEKMKPDIIDINMGCPVPKVALRAQAGAALLKDIDKIYDIVSSVVKSVPVPVTVKIRSGWDNKSINAIEVAKTCEKAGASAICVHPRTRSQGYEGFSNWNIIKEVKDSVSIPVIGNGDIKTFEDAYKMLEETKCDAIMIGRGALGNPWLIKEILNMKKEIVTNKDKLNMCLKHFEYLLEIKSEKLSLLEIRTHVGWYIKGIPNGNQIKKEIYMVKNKKEFYDLIHKYLLN
ncbi:MAG: tRNA dihydrouridine synthase DusB [Tenericutes bacterium]|nr:tRNA dihydrouridine synthase DusB [Mycoplasmatota bacterium]